MNAFRLGLVLATAFSAVLTIRAREQTRKVPLYVFKPLTLILIIVSALVKRADHTAYFYGIMAGLVFCLLGDIFLMFPEQRFTAGLGSFLIGHILYTVAFVSDVGFGFSPIVLCPFAVYGFWMCKILFPHLGRMKLPVLIYTAVLLIMAWQAWERWLGAGQNLALLASTGAFLFVVSDSVLAINRFRGKFRYAQTIILSTYYAAQMFIVWSLE